MIRYSSISFLLFWLVYEFFSNFLIAPLREYFYPITFIHKAFLSLLIITISLIVNPFKRKKNLILTLLYLLFYYIFSLNKELLNYKIYIDPIFLFFYFYLDKLDHNIIIVITSLVILYLGYAFLDIYPLILAIPILHYLESLSKIHITLIPKRRDNR
jgi:hypothetical protein